MTICHATEDKSDTIPKMLSLIFPMCLFVGCASKSADTASLEAACTTIDSSDVTWNTWSQGFFMTWCQACHSATTQNRHGAPEGIDFDTETEVMQWRERILIRVIVDQSMPLGGGLSSADLDLLQRYFDNVSCP